LNDGLTKQRVAPPRKQKPTDVFVSVYDFKEHKYADYTPYDPYEGVDDPRRYTRFAHLPESWLERYQNELKARLKSRIKLFLMLLAAAFALWVLYRTVDQLIQAYRKGDWLSRLGRNLKRALAFTFNAVDRVLYTIKAALPLEETHILRRAVAWVFEENINADKALITKQAEAAEEEKQLLARRAELHAEMLRRDMTRPMTPEEQAKLSQLAAPRQYPLRDFVRAQRRVVGDFVTSTTETAANVSSHTAFMLDYASIWVESVVDIAKAQAKRWNLTRNILPDR
jgi:hypothetical protein